MVNWFKLLPPYLVVLIVILLLLPTVAAILLRISLYKHLNDIVSKVGRLSRPGNSRGQQPKIVCELEERFRQVINHLDQVNTAALIDKVYSQTQFNFLGLSLPCEQWDYFCKVLPNLLLAFGLLGTFLGITLNLYELSQTIDKVDSDVVNFIQELQLPLQSMGVAFVTSLMALGCSSLLIGVNLRCNTNIAKYRLISSLEDYLDNIFRSAEQGDTRLDKAINKMVEQQHEFLVRFHEKVGQVLESTLGRTVEKIATENERANALARNVYEKLLDSSSTFARGASTFQEASFLLERQVKAVTVLVPSFQESSRNLTQGAMIFQNAAARIEQSKFSDHLGSLITSLEKNQTELAQFLSTLGKETGQMVESNKKASDLAQQVYSQLQDASVKLQNSTVGFIEASERIEQSQFANKLSTATADLAVMQEQFTQATSVLQESTQPIASAIAALQNSVENLSEFGSSINTSNQRATQLLEKTETRLADEQEGVKAMIAQLSDLTTSVINERATTNTNFHRLEDCFVDGVEQQIQTINQQAQQLSNQLNQQFSLLDKTASNLIDSTNIFADKTKQLTNHLQLYNQRFTANVGSSAEMKGTRLNPSKPNSR